MSEMDSEIKRKILGLFLLMIGILLICHAFYIFIDTTFERGGVTAQIALIHGIEMILGFVLAPFGWRILKGED